MDLGAGTEINRKGGESHDDTSFHVRRAGQGDRASLEWIVQRFSPLLLAQAEYRMGPRLRAVQEPEDLVQDVWAITLPRVVDLCAREGRATPVVLKFLSTTLLFRVNDLLKKRLVGVKDGAAARDGSGSAGRNLLSDLAAETSGVIAAAVRSEMRHVVLMALGELDPQDREILILRGIEQNSNETVCMLLKLTPSAVSMRFKRALERLRARLPRSVFDEIDGD